MGSSTRSDRKTCPAKSDGITKPADGDRSRRARSPLERYPNGYTCHFVRPGLRPPPLLGKRRTEASDPGKERAITRTAASSRSAHGYPGARPQRSRKPGHPESRRYQPGRAALSAQASGGRGHLRPGRIAAVRHRRAAAHNGQRRRGPDCPGRHGPRGEEHRHRQRGGARHVHRREREAIPRGGRLS